MKNKNVVLNPNIGDRVKFCVSVPEQNIGTTLESREGVVTKINRTTFVVEEETGTAHKIAKEWYPRATALPHIIKPIKG